MEGETIALNPATVEVDAAVFERLVGEATPEALERAVTLYHGDLLEGIGVNEAAFAEWLTSERERLRGLALQAFTDVLAHQSKAGQTQRAIQTAVRLLAMDASQEIVHRALMRLYARQGRRGAALKQYQVCVAALQRELGTEPEPETKQLYQDILQRRAPEPLKSDIAEPAHPRGARRAPPESRPEPITRDAPLIGRESELIRLRQALDRASRGDGQVVAITGEAGIGKSSVLMALATDAYARGIRVLLGRSYQTEQVLRDEERASAPVLRQVGDELAREPHFVHLAVMPLSRAGTTALVRSLVSASTARVDARLDTEIWRASAGNPFLVVETIRAIEEGTPPHTPAALPLP